MKIGFRCRHCRQKLTISATAAGKRRRCPRCEMELIVPRPPVATPEAVPGQQRGEPPAEMGSAAWDRAAWQTKSGRPLYRETAERWTTTPAPAFPPDGLPIIKAFGPPIAKTEATLAYRLGVVIVALVMVALPTIYFTLVGAICYAVYWYFVEGQFLLLAATGSAAARWGLGGIVGVVGSVVVFFLLKPFFARPIRIVRTQSITPQNEPLMFAFVARVCDVVGAPFPSRIDVSYDVNASASFRAGLGSIWKGNDLVLTIGLPLVANLTMRQFAGVLAHEFGHFSQGTGMRLAFLIRAISDWFARVVFERDQWDAFLQRLCGPEFLLLSVVVWPARACVWLSRQILRLLMNIGLLVGGFLLREMEYDADRYEARVAGSDQFADTSWRIQMTGYAWLHAQSQISQLAERDILVDDVALLIRHQLASMPDAFKEQIRREFDSGKWGLFDSHPSEAARFQNVRREGASGIFQLEEDAHRLFADFETLSKNVTFDLYNQILRQRVRREMLQDTQTVLLRYRIGTGIVRPWNEPDYYD